MKNNNINLNVVIGSWKAYNEARNERALGSKWLSLQDFNSLDDLIEELKQEGFTDEELEETFIQDIEEDEIEFSNCDYISLEEIWHIYETLNEPDDKELVLAIIEVFGLYETLEMIEDGRIDDYYLSSCQDASDYAYELFEEGAFGNIENDFLSNYIDFDAIGRDMLLNSEIHETSKGVLVGC